MKPNISAFGHVIGYSGSDYIHETQGTSFATPLIAGFAACAWQANRELSNMDLFIELEKSSSLFPYYDYAHGYGIPNATYFLEKDFIKQTKATFDIIEYKDSLQIIIKEEYYNSETSNLAFNTIDFEDLYFHNNSYHFHHTYNIEKSSIKKGNNNYFYYHICI